VQLCDKYGCDVLTNDLLLHHSAINNVIRFPLHRVDAISASLSTSRNIFYIFLARSLPSSQTVDGVAWLLL